MSTDERELDFRDREVVVRADFSELDDEDCLPVSLRFIMSGPRAPRVGEWVYLLDSRGSGCLAKVDCVDGWVARVKPDWETWAGDGRPPGVASSS